MEKIKELELKTCGAYFNEIARLSPICNMTLLKSSTSSIAGSFNVSVSGECVNWHLKHDKSILSADRPI